MNSDYQILEATHDHVEALKSRLRPLDLLEIEASSGRRPSLALELSWRVSEVCWTGLIKGEVVTMFGAGRKSLISRVGVPWMLGSQELSGAGLEVGRRSKEYVKEMKSHFARLENFIDARQTRSIRWLRWCGFSIEPAAPYGVKGLPFHRFHME